MFKKVLYPVFLIVLFFISASSAEAALLYVSPADGVYTQGERVNLQIYVSSNTSLNAVSGTLSFPIKNFVVESVSKSGSILSFWVEEPSFSNTEGTISFEGVSPGSGYDGSRGKVISVTLRALQPGEGEVSFQAGSILANDGTGANILHSFGNSDFVIKASTPKSAVPTTEAPETGVYTGPPESPVIEKYKSEITPDEFFRIEGSTIYPDAEVIFQFESEGGSAIRESTQAFSSGRFVFTLGQTLKSGVYKVSAVVADRNGVRSAPSKTIIISVRPSPWVVWGNRLVQVLSVAIPFISVVILFALIMFYGWHKVKKARKNLRREVKEAEESLHKACLLLQEDVEEHVKLLERANANRTLTAEEGKILKNLKKNMADAEKYVAKEIKDIDRELN